MLQPERTLLRFTVFPANFHIYQRVFSPRICPKG